MTVSNERLEGDARPAISRSTRNPLAGAQRPPTDEVNRPNREPDEWSMTQEAHGWVRVERRVRLQSRSLGCSEYKQEASQVLQRCQSNIDC